MVVRLLRSRWAYSLARGFAGGIFVAAGASKAFALDRFAEAVGAHGIVFDGAVEATAAGIAGLEIAAGLGLIFDVRGALALTATLLVLFCAVLGYGILLGLDIDCGCLAFFELRGDKTTLREALWRDLLLLALCGYLYWLRFAIPRRPWRLARLFSGRRRPRQEGRLPS
ncbi:MAG: hypothetical protein HY721_10515 [Planctomycetes bacterium]|nr:hypothetical protein [Planctomycetota bacterium]